MFSEPRDRAFPVETRICFGYSSAITLGTRIPTIVSTVRRISTATEDVWPVHVFGKCIAIPIFVESLSEHRNIDGEE
jgi:hypothetical protein